MLQSRLGERTDQNSSLLEKIVAETGKKESFKEHLDKQSSSKQ